jgi:hypothetical protein
LFASRASVIADPTICAVNRSARRVGDEIGDVAVVFGDQDVHVDSMLHRRRVRGDLSAGTALERS